MVDVDEKTKNVACDICKKIIMVFYSYLGEKFGIMEVLLNKVNIYEAKEMPLFGGCPKDIPWHTFSIAYETKNNFTEYITIWNFEENYTQIQRVLQCEPLTDIFMATFLIGMIHEFRHIVQLEYKTNIVRPDMIKDDDKFRSLIEKDAIEFADKFYLENEDEIMVKINHILDHTLQRIIYKTIPTKY